MLTISTLAEECAQEACAAALVGCVYDRLLEVLPSPVVALNRTVPLAMVC